MSESWHIDGEYFESCNCEVLCPCLLVRPQVAPTEGHCDVVMAMRVDSGKYGQVDLSGLTAVLAIYTPGIMSHGNWTVAPYLDERANPAQRDALEKIITAQAGGPLSRFASLIANLLPAKTAPIKFYAEGRVRKLVIPDIADVTVEGIVGASSGLAVESGAGVAQSEADRVVFLENVGHFASRRLATAMGTSARFKDHSLTFDNSGRNGHYSTIKWSNA